MKISQIMTKKPVTSPLNEPIFKIAQKMKNDNIGSVLILKNDKLVGIVTDRDIVVRAVAQNLDLSAHQAYEIMTPNPYTVKSDDEIEKVALLMADKKVRRLPVMSAGKLVGIVTLDDLAQALHQHEQLLGALLELIASRKAA